MIAKTEELEDFKPTYKGFTAEQYNEVIKYEPICGTFYRKNNLLCFSNQDKRSKAKIQLFIAGKTRTIPAANLAYFLAYGLEVQGVLLHRDLDNFNLKINNLIDIPKDEYNKVISYCKIIKNLRIKVHPKEPMKLQVEYTFNNLTKRKIFHSIEGAERYVFALKYFLLKKLKDFGVDVDSEKVQKSLGITFKF